MEELTALKKGRPNYAFFREFEVGFKRYKNK